MSANSIPDYTVHELCDYYFDSDAKVKINKEQSEDSECSGSEVERNGSAYDFLLTSHKTSTPVLPRISNVFDEEIHCSVCRHRRFKSDCYFKMCYQCCRFSSDKINGEGRDKNACEVHTMEFNKKAETDRFIKEALDFHLGHASVGSTASLYHKGKKLKQFVHPEAKFDNINQTAVIWCTVDFGRFKKYSDDCFAQESKRQRLIDKRKRSRVR